MLEAGILIPEASLLLNLMHGCLGFRVIFQALATYRSLGRGWSYRLMLGMGLYQLLEASSLTLTVGTLTLVQQQHGHINVST